jgi:8-amino-7-oxononanoate synthase
MTKPDLSNISLDRSLSDLDNKLSQVLDQRKQQHRYRRRRITSSPQGVECIVDGKPVISFCSNDYLGFANHPKVREAAEAGIRKYGVGSGAAHLINGHTEAHHLLEEELAEFTGYPRALLFSTGYMANIGLCQALLDKNGFVFEDKLNHASLIDGGLISGARFQRYLHNDVESLSKKLSRTDNDAMKLVLSDAVFSMDGDIADAPALAAVCREHDSVLMLDDAHGFGVSGQDGKGTLQYFDMTPGDVPVYMATLGKAMGTAGAFIAGSEALIETLIQQARTYIYTTAMPAAIAEATRASLRLLIDEAEHRSQLKENINYFRSCCQQTAIAVQRSETAIQPIIIGEDANTLALSNKLFDAGILVTPIRPPTVPEGTSRLRITLCATHTREHIDKLVGAIQDHNVN